MFGVGEVVLTNDGTAWFVLRSAAALKLFLFLLEPLLKDTCEQLWLRAARRRLGGPLPQQQRRIHLKAYPPVQQRAKTLKAHKVKKRFGRTKLWQMQFTSLQ